MYAVIGFRTHETVAYFTRRADAVAWVAREHVRGDCSYAIVRVTS